MGHESSLAVMEGNDKEWDLLVQELVPPEARNGEPYVPSAASDMW